MVRAQSSSKFHAFFWRVIDHQHAVHTGGGRVFHKAVSAVKMVVVFYGVGIAHQHNRCGSVGGAELAHHGQHFAHAHTVSQRSFTGFLNHRPVGHRVAERHAQLDDVSAALYQGMHQRQSV